MDAPVKKKSNTYRSPDTRPQRHQPIKGPCYNFCMSIGVTSPKNEEQAALELLIIHENWIIRENRRVRARTALPKWKKWIIYFLQLPV